jgi:hypothetical protein
MNPTPRSEGQNNPRDRRDILSRAIGCPVCAVRDFAVDNILVVDLSFKSTRCLRTTVKGRVREMNSHCAYPGFPNIVLLIYVLMQLVSAYSAAEVPSTSVISTINQECWHQCGVNWPLTAAPNGTSCSVLASAGCARPRFKTLTLYRRTRL